jgi:transposase
MPKPESMALPPTQVTPEPALERRSRRQFSLEYKLRIISEAEQCQRGELGALLRREKLYSSQLHTWRRELTEQGAEGLSKTAPGPKAKLSPEQRELETLRAQNARLTRKLEIAEGCITLQKKVLRMLELSERGDES